MHDFIGTEQAKTGYAQDMHRWLKSEPWDDETVEQQQKTPEDKDAQLKKMFGMVL